MSTSNGSGDASYSLTIKWGKETLTISNFRPVVGVKGLKAELEELTSVPVDRQKIMAKSKGLWKGVLKDDYDLSSISWSTISSSITLLLMGSAATLSGPKTKTVFLEDLPPEQVAKVVEPSGLVNLGNTCYLNSVVQCLRTVPYLRKGLVSYRPQSNNDNSSGMGGGPPTPLAVLALRQRLLQSLRDTFTRLDGTAEAVQPITLVQSTQLQFPQFAKRTHTGQPMQQDAEEYYSALLTVLASEMVGWENISSGFKAEDTNEGGDGGVTKDELLGADNLIDAIFGMKMKETLTCDEFDYESNEDGMQVDTEASAEKAATEAAAAPIEPPVFSFDLLRKLVCNIQGGSDGASTTNVSHISEGIRLSLQGKIEKRSDILGRDAIWTRKQRLARLPPILTVQFGRFYWKATPDSQDHAGVKCKVMKPVAFEGMLDVYEFCTPEIQKVLQVSRRKAAAAIEAELEAKEKKMRMETGGLKKEEEEKDDGDDKKKSSTTEPMVVEGGEKKADDADDEEKAALEAALAMSMEEALPPIGPGLPDDFEGKYELFAVVTHKGRDADGGHYMAWVKAEKPPAPASKGGDDSKKKATTNNSNNNNKIADTDEENEDWYVFDDDQVSPCKTEDVLKLKGGGDWHMSYLNFYRAKK